MKIAILGTGNMGRALGLRFALAGHPVFFGGRTPTAAPAQAAADAQKFTSTPSTSGTIAEAAAYGDVLIWTPRERDPHQLFPDGNAALSALRGKIVVDLNNRDYAHDVAGPDSKWFERSLGEQLQEALPGCKVVKCFNTIPMGTLDVPAEKLRASGAQVFTAADDGEAAKVVGALAGELGFEAVHLGGGKTAMRAADALGDVIRFILIDGGVKGANIGIRSVQDGSLGVVGQRQPSAYQ